jgi:putative membrane protein
MIVTWAAGLWMIWAGGWIQAGWLQVKLVLVVLMSGLHGMSARYVHDFAADRNRRTHVFYRVFNEVPTLLMVVIVILAVVKPF